MNSGLYECEIYHERLSPKRHRFSYRLFFLDLDLDELPASPKLTSPDMAGVAGMAGNGAGMDPKMGSSEGMFSSFMSVSWLPRPCGRLLTGGGKGGRS